ncbi:MAG: SAM-dependent DNA methyltransferase [Nitrospira sp.]|nr:SAM-dependent DNA methyltransferase [Nitrospira sp.]
MDRQILSKQRVTDHGEVLTGKREVNAMLDLEKSETERIDSRFLEPACGTGNFLAAILERKLRVVEARYGKSQLEFERYSILAISSIYGIDILEDNIKQCRARLFGIFDLNYLRLFKNKSTDDCRESVRYILKQNIIHGDALSLTTVGDNPKPIVFSEWSPVNGSMLKRRDFTFYRLLVHEATKEMPLFSDLGEDVFIPTPEKEYAPIHFLKVVDANKQ